MTEKEERLNKANELLVTIAHHGRRFFRHGDNVARLELRKGRVWFIDAYTNKAIYMHHGWGKFRGFTEGGTLRALVVDLRTWICTGKQLQSPYLFGPWPEHYCKGDLWGYGEEMATVRTKAVEIGFFAPRATSQPVNFTG